MLGSRPRMSAMALLSELGAAPLPMMILRLAWDFRRTTKITASQEYAINQNQ